MEPILVSPFFDGAAGMRSEFERQVGPARTAEAARFVWDYWHVPGQYSYLRTPARRFFTATLYGRFISAVRAWGTQTLGCTRVSDPWLSYYLHGCRQELHADVPQGPWSYVYSLTQDPAFTGGETLLLRDSVLDYWSGFDDSRALERDDLLHRVPSRFDQLTVFDARIPHGVSMVEGTADPLRSRVVVHGWFLPPSLSVRGALRRDQVTEPLAAASRLWADAVRDCGLRGTAVWELRVESSGVPNAARPLGSTLVSTTSAAPARVDGALARVAQALAATRFPAAAGISTLLVPVTGGGR